MTNLIYSNGVIYQYDTIQRIHTLRITPNTPPTACVLRDLHAFYGAHQG